MENKVGDNFPSAGDLAKIIKTVGEVRKSLAKFCVNLLPAERATLTRGRLGAEEHLKLLAKLGEKYGWSAAGCTPDGLYADLRTDQELAPIEQELEVMLQMVRDTRAQARSEATEAGYLFYAQAQGLASRIPEVRDEIRPVADFLSTPRKRAKPTP